jgi:flavin reductase (DIM6/NTAB) family NADH-FMN oxidoreductase RutF
VDDAEKLTLSFLSEGHRDALALCGKVSGRDCDKITEAGLHTVTDGDIAYFEESRLVVCGKKIYVSEFKEENFLDPTIIDSKYPLRDYHKVYVCEIEKVLIKD